MVSKYFNLLKQKNFFLLWFGQIVSQFGDRLTQIALIGLVSKASKSSFNLAVVMSLSIIPVFIISPISGVYIDRWSKRKTMYISDISRGFLILLIPIFFLKFHSLWPIYLLIFLSFSASRFFIPAKMAFIPHTIDKKNIFLANSLISVTAMSAAVMGIGIGGIIVEKFGTTAAFTIDAFTFIISAAAIFLITIREKGGFLVKDILNIGKDVIDNVKDSFTHELKEGIRYIFRSSETKYAFKIYLFLFSYVGGLYVVLIRFIQNVLSSVTEGLGFAAVSMGTGLFISTLIYGRFADKFPIKKIMNFSVSISSLYLIFFSVFLKYHPYLYNAVFLSFILGLLISPVFIGVNAIIHKKSESNLLGRIFSSLELISHLGFLSVMFISAKMADIYSPFTVIVSIGIIGFFCSLIFIFGND